MTIPASTVKAAKLFLYNGITSLVADPSVLVSYDPPGENQPNDVVVVAAVDRTLSVMAIVGSGGRGWLREDYTIEVGVSIYRGGDDAQTAFERACDLVDIVVQVVRTDPTLGGAVITATPTGSVITPDWEDKHLGRLVDAVVTISCFAQI